MSPKRSAQATLRQIKLLLLDVDGVLTDGGIYYSERGEELKKFNIHDGYGIVKLQKTGVRVGILTGRMSKLVTRRAKELGITEVYQNLEDKVEAYEQVKRKLGVQDAEIAYLGDDEPDLPIVERVGFSACPEDAADAVRRRVDFVCKRRGGEGAVREVIDLILGNRADGA